MTAILAFAIETIPDIAGIRLLHDLPADLPDSDVAEFAFQRQRATNGSDLLAHHLQRVVAISCVLRFDEHRFKVWTIGQAGDDEASMIKAFFDGITKFTPTLVSWNGSDFDLPVLHFRALRHGIPAPAYWGPGENEFKQTTRLGPCHLLHTDLMDIMAMHQPCAFVPLDEMARLCGFPGRPGTNDSSVWPAFQAGDMQRIREQCEIDVLNSYLLYQRFRLMRANLTSQAYASEMDLVRGDIARSGAKHWQEFLAAWPV